MDTFLTVTIVAVAAFWAALRLFRRPRPGACNGPCAGCAGTRGPETGPDACAPASGPPGLPSRNFGGR